MVSCMVKLAEKGLSAGFGGLKAYGFSLRLGGLPLLW